MKKIKCILGIHYPELLGYNFTDMVSGDAVNDYTCSECKKTWMATSKYSFFKVFKTTNGTPTKINLN